MKKNAIYPYLIIMAFGIGLVFALSFIGLYEGEGQADGGDSTDGQGVVAQTPEEIYTNTCIACHGQNYEGASGPALINVGDRLSRDEIKDVLVNGRGIMPGGTVPEEQLDEMVDWLMNLK
ncbi:cytochrome c550 [Fervidibacillus halotolerans]|uniref:Cytochrome c n=1 Tax=Fervidibacillus halotolerans TaxID=2980027 RepID=A0A9E8LXF4_9BACI|nr:cytochrome c [Fervidibacillus halotolerans]WAA11483.1 cytochrome c [Fervidibacillus halotolerans]